MHLRAWNLTTTGSCYNTRLIAALNAKHPIVDQIYLGVTCFYMFAALYISIGVDEAIEMTAKKLPTRLQDLQLELPNPVRDLLAAVTAFRNRLHEIQLEGSAWVQDLHAPMMGVENSRLYSELLFGAFLPQTETTKEEATAFTLATTRRTALSLALAQYPLHLYNVFALRASNQHLLIGESENTWGFGQIVALVMLVQTFVECFRGVEGTLHKTLETINADKRPEYREEKRTILAAESLRSIARRSKIPTNAESV